LVRGRVDKVVLRTFQREVEQQCRFALIAAEDTRQALQEWEGLSDEMEQTFEELVRQEMRARGQSGPALAVVSVQNEFGHWWERHDAIRDRFWFSVQSLLMAAANVSKLLWPTYCKGEKLIPERGEELRKSLAIGDKHSPLSDRTLRNHFEHYDARLEHWAATSEKRALYDLGMRSFGSASTPATDEVRGSGDPGDQMRAFDADSNTITFRGEVYQLQLIIDALADIRARAKSEAQKP
jgi:hypothetical protein